MSVIMNDKHFCHVFCVLEYFWRFFMKWKWKIKAPPKRMNLKKGKCIIYFLLRLAGWRDDLTDLIRKMHIRTISTILNHPNLRPDNHSRSNSCGFTPASHKPFISCLVWGDISPVICPSNARDGRYRTNCLCLIRKSIRISQNPESKHSFKTAFH